MKTADFGRVLVAMAKYAIERAESRKDYLGQRNCELLFALGFTFQAGAEACIRIAEEDLTDANAR